MNDSCEIMHVTEKNMLSIFDRSGPGKRVEQPRPRVYLLTMDDQKLLQEYSRKSPSPSFD